LPGRRGFAMGSPLGGANSCGFLELNGKMGSFGDSALRQLRSGAVGCELLIGHWHTSGLSIQR
jgi:hypothetical protein